MITIDPHPSLELAYLTATFPRPLGEMATPDAVLGLFSVSAKAPMSSSDEVREKVRDMLRHGGYKPTGRGKPASEYLLRAASEGKLGPINLPVDICNAVSLHSGLPISVVDLGRAAPPFRAGIATAGQSYVFNASGQEIDLQGLLCLFDAEGPCANAVKDSQRTKTSAQTTRVLVCVWGHRELPGRALEAARWYAGLVNEAGGSSPTEQVLQGKV
jgi:DNA/RNA-binding domain of Phe-tRNA-synthetase-like protein